VVNAWTIMLSDRFVSGIRMGGFLNSLLAAFIISVLHHFLLDMKKAS
jgi:putative membrane protein